MPWLLWVPPVVWGMGAEVGLSTTVERVVPPLLAALWLLTLRLLVIWLLLRVLPPPMSERSVVPMSVVEQLE